MKEFDLSDKELKSLLQEDGIESPSMGFNKAIMSKIDTYEKTKVSPVKAPKWLIFGLMAVLIAPTFIFFTEGAWDLNALTKDLEMPALSLDFTINTTYFWISALTIVVVSMAILFDKFVLKSLSSPR